jgi:diguanylate cyclase (GGDEF)-like protein
MHQSLHEMWAAFANGDDPSRDLDSDEARALARAVENSIDRGEPVAELRLLAGNWGALHSHPEAVVSAITSLREASLDLLRMRPVSGEHAPARLELLLAVLDDVLLGAIEGVSSRLREAALTDPLTGCANRRALEDDLERSIASARRTGFDVSIAVIDLDGLKRINDSHGHAAGDATLKALAQSLGAAVRDTDAVYRVGGDEFVVLVPFSAKAGAAAIMKRAQDSGAPSFSWGVASLSMLDPGCTPEDLVALADASLYASRRNLRTEMPARPNRHRIVLAVVGLALAGITGLTAYDRPSGPPSRAAGAPGAARSAGTTPLVEVRAPHLKDSTPPRTQSTSPRPVTPRPASIVTPPVEIGTRLTEKEEPRQHHVVPVYGGILDQSPTTTVNPGPILTVTVTRLPPKKTTSDPPVLTTTPTVSRVHVGRKRISPPRTSLPPWTTPIGIRISDRHRCGIRGIHVFQGGSHHPVHLSLGHTPHRQFPNEENSIFDS